MGKKVVDESESTENVQDGSTEAGSLDLFVTLFHKTQERLMAMRRARERKIASEFQLKDEELEEFRSDLIELHELFCKFDVDDVGTLEDTEVMKLLMVCGSAQAKR